MKRSWIDEQYDQLHPVLPHLIHVARQHLDTFSECGLACAAIGPHQMEQVIRKLDVALGGELDHLNWKNSLEHELRDPADDEVLFRSEFRDSDGDLHTCGTRRNDFEAMYILTTRIRLRRLLAPAETPPPVDVSNVLPFVLPMAPAVAAIDDNEHHDDDLPIVPSTLPPVLLSWPPIGFYASPYWHQHSAAVRREWNYSCALNARHPGPVEVHHRTYERVGHEAPLDCVPLCEECHERFHDRLPKQRTLDVGVKKAA